MRRRVGAALFAFLLLPASALAQDVEHLEVGDPERRGQQVALVLDGIVNSHTAELLTSTTTSSDSPVAGRRAES